MIAILSFFLKFQLMLTFGAMAFVMNYEPAQDWMLENSSWIFIVSLMILFSSMCAMACCVDLRRKTPYNYLLLGVFTIAEAFLLSMVTMRFPSGVVSYDQVMYIYTLHTHFLTHPFSNIV